MLKRRFYQTLLEWKNSPRRNAMLVTGARQVGKTTLIRQFCQEQYDCFAELNFIEDPSLCASFRASRDANTVIENLSAWRVRQGGSPLEPGRTLIFLDEIQECPEARTAIKFLVEDGRFDYIESGSLLGVRTKEVMSYPVGYETVRQMFPMDLEEFAWARGMGEEAFGAARRAFASEIPVHPYIHQALLRLFYLYILVGGMPDAVRTFAETHDIGKVILRQKDILEVYRQDIAKYAPARKAKIYDIFDKIPSQLGEKSRRFMVASIKKSARFAQYEDSFVWLRDAGVALPCYNVAELKLPLAINEQRTLFKLFLADTGLLSTSCMDKKQYDVLMGNLQMNMGGVMENAFAQIFVSKGYALRYFSKPQYGEIDFVLHRGTQCLPVEIKSGGSCRSHAALDSVLRVDAWGIDKAYVFCRENVAVDGKVRYLPWYMAMCLEPDDGNLGRPQLVDWDFSDLSDENIRRLLSQEGEGAQSPQPQGGALK
jgi:predicted AAA+ superfamily ATPase